MNYSLQNNHELEEFPLYSLFSKHTTSKIEEHSENQISNLHRKFIQNGSNRSSAKLAPIGTGRPSSNRNSSGQIYTNMDIVRTYQSIQQMENRQRFFTRSTLASSGPIFTPFNQTQRAYLPTSMAHQQYYPVGIVPSQQNNRYGSTISNVDQVYNKNTTAWTPLPVDGLPNLFVSLEQSQLYTWNLERYVNGKAIQGFNNNTNQNLIIPRPFPEVYGAIANSTQAIDGFSRRAIDVLPGQVPHGYGSAPRQVYSQVPRQDNGTMPRQDYVSMPNQDYGSMPRQNNGLVPRQDYGSVPKQDYGSIPRQDYGPMPTQGNGPMPRKDYGFMPKQDYRFLPRQDCGLIPTQRNGPMQRQGYGSMPKQDYGYIPRQDYDSMPKQDYRFMPRQDYGPMLTQDYGPMTRQNYGLMPRHDNGPMPTQDYGPMPTHDYGPMQKQNGGAINIEGNNHNGNKQTMPTQHQILNRDWATEGDAETKDSYKKKRRTHIFYNSNYGHRRTNNNKS